MSFSFLFLYNYSFSPSFLSSYLSNSLIFPLSLPSSSHNFQTYPLSSSLLFFLSHFSYLPPTLYSLYSPHAATPFASLSPLRAELGGGLKAGRRGFKMVYDDRKLATRFTCNGSIRGL
ncbi:hypothetical protein E2C01_020637 [Portunus trituberculatus]|uniref:Uncharacterized protein n=1 Tax=Portunus trituberculatus TaxID=210409 RepID=A0A5B7E2A1_PORTR|nr:hypothetical protein [Portunus trituberculatus]